MWNPSAAHYQILDTGHRLHLDRSGCYWLDVVVALQTSAEPASLELWLCSDSNSGYDAPPSPELRATRPVVCSLDGRLLVTARFRLGPSVGMRSFRPVVGDGLDGNTGFLIALGHAHGEPLR
jgi:hypothetical protein